MKRVLIVFVMTLAFVTGAQAANAPSNSTEGPDLSKATEASAAKVKYKAGKEMNFEELIIQGQLKRPEISVVMVTHVGMGSVF